MAAVESWFAATAVAEPLPAPARRRPRRTPVTAARPRVETRAQGRHVHRVRWHMVWMVLFAVLLAGVVAMNVAVLRSNVAVHRLDQQIAQTQAGNQARESQLAAKTSAQEVEAWATRNGLVQATSTSYLTVGGR